MARKQSDDDGKPNHNPSGDERPWDEARWRKFLRESDVRAARYAELFETLVNDPYRDVKIAHEMGWDEPRRRDVGEFASWNDDSGASDTDPVADELESDDTIEADDADEVARLEFLDEIDPNDPELLAEAEADRKALHAIPAYRTGNQLARLIIHAMRPFEHIEDERLSAAIEHAMIPGAKIAGGHGIGYEHDAICGNIVCNTIALDHARKALVEFNELKDDKVLPGPVIDRILPKVRELITQLETRITELRARVTW
jgi:hypothetical protein